MTGPLNDQANVHAFEDIIYEKRHGVAKIIINRPHVRNALRPKTYEELYNAFRDAADDDEVGVIVLTGAGDEAFCAGGDVSDQAQRTPSAGRKLMRRLLLLGTLMRSCGKPIIAAVKGYAVGSGHELHLFCDITIAAENAKFGQVGPRVGSVPVWGGVQLLPRIVGEKRAREMIFTCRLYDAYEAERMGLVNKVVPLSQLDEEVSKLCEEILDKSPQSLRIAKTVLNFESDLLHAAYTHGMEMLALTYGSEEQREGVSAFLEKRKPDFRRFRSAGS
jgi:naphthoate synthase/2-ketocyclohexanecarboxyl-CoA hydrolase